jgi:hypothetical protein
MQKESLDKILFLGIFILLFLVSLKFSSLTGNVTAVAKGEIVNI